MNFEEKILEAMKEMYPDAEVLVTDVKKTNVSYRALIIRENDSYITPSINLSEAEEFYNNTEDFGVVVSRLVNIYEQSKRNTQIVPDLTKENILEHMTLRLLNAERNPEMLSNSPVREWNDLIIVPTFVSVTGEEMASFALTNGLCRMLDISPDEAFEAGMKHMQPDFDSLARKLSGYMEKTKDFTEENIRDVVNMADDAGMFILTSSSQRYGASSIINEDVMESIAKSLDDDLFILPSSVHEVLILRAEGLDSKHLADMVKEVNATAISAADFLSDNVYFYDRELKQTKVAQRELGDDYGI